jgi:hypothetical protein
MNCIKSGEPCSVTAHLHTKIKTSIVSNHHQQQVSIKTLANNILSAAAMAPMLTRVTHNDNFKRPTGITAPSAYS